MKWLERIFGPHVPPLPPDKELEEARIRRRDLMTRLVLLGTEADVLLAQEDRKGKRD